MAYATIEDVRSRMTRSLSEDEQTVCDALLADAAAIIDAYNEDACLQNKMIVSCRMVIRAIGDSNSAGVPMGATQGSMSALGYSQSWTIGASGSVGELYLSKLEKKLLGSGDKIGSYSPTEGLVGGDISW